MTNKACSQPLCFTNSWRYFLRLVCKFKESTASGLLIPAITVVIFHLTGYVSVCVCQTERMGGVGLHSTWHLQNAEISSTSSTLAFSKTSSVCCLYMIVRDITHHAEFTVTSRQILNWSGHEIYIVILRWCPMHHQINTTLYYYLKWLLVVSYTRNSLEFLARHMACLDNWQNRLRQNFHRHLRKLRRVRQTFSPS